MKYYILFIISALSLWSCTPKDEDSPAPSEVFVKYYGSEGTVAIDLVRTSSVSLKGDTVDNFIILASYNNGFSLIKVDNEGNQIANAEFYPMGDASIHVPKRIKPLPNGQFLIVGYAQAADDLTEATGLWAKIDGNLEVVVGFNQIEGVFLTDMIQSLESDGVDKVVAFGHYLRVTTDNAGIVTEDLQLYISKRDYGDSTFWEKNNGFDNDEESLAIFQNASDSSLVLIGSASTTGQGKDIYVVQTTKLGTADKGSISTGVSGSQAGADDIPYAAIKTSLGYSVVGSTHDANGQLSGFHMAFSRGGQLVSGSSHILETSYNTAWQAFGVTKSTDNGLIVVGSIPSFSGVGEGNNQNRGEEAILMKINPLSGNIEGREDQSFGTNVGNDQAVAAITLPDGDILVAATFDFGSGTTLAGLMRLNREGELRD